MGRTTLPWVLRYPAPRAGAAAERVWFDEHDLKGMGRVDELLELAEEDTTFPNAAKASVKVLAQPLDGLDKSIDDLEDEIVSAHAQSEKSRLRYEVPGIGTS